MRGSIRYLLALLAVSWAGTHAAAGDPSVRSFLDDYREATKKILQVYDSIRMDCKQIDPSGVEESWKYSRRQRSTRWVKVDPKTGGASALVSDPDQSFKLSRNSGSSQYAVMRIADAAPKAMRSYVASIEARTLPAYAPYRAYLEEPIDKFLSEPRCTINSIVWEGQSPNRLIRVGWEIAPTKPNGKTRYGRFEILPDAGWVLKSYAIYFRDGYKDKATGRMSDLGRGGDLEYEGEQEGIPLIRRVSTWTSAVEKAAGPTYEVTKIEPGPIPREDFTLASFGIDTRPIAARTPVAYPLLALSAACGAGVLLLRYLWGRSARAPLGGLS